MRIGLDADAEADVDAVVAVAAAAEAEEELFLDEEGRGGGGERRARPLVASFIAASRGITCTVEISIVPFSQRAEPVLNCRRRRTIDLRTNNCFCRA